MTQFNALLPYAVQDLKPYEKNAKKHSQAQVERIAQSIRDFGFNQPIVIDRNRVVIVGHGRLEAAILLELEHVPAIMLDITEDQARAYRLADNKLNESDWDMDLVLEELKHLQSVNFDIGVTGFEMQSILPPVDLTKDKNTVEESYETYKNNSIKQVVLYFSGQQFETVMAQLERIRGDFDVDNNTDAIAKLLEYYEQMMDK